MRYVWIIEPCYDSDVTQCLNTFFMQFPHHEPWCLSGLKLWLYSPVFWSEQQCVYPYLYWVSALLWEQVDSWHPWLVMGDTCHFAFHDGLWICSRRGASYEKPSLEWCDQTCMTQDPLLFCCIRVETFLKIHLYFLPPARSVFAFVITKAQGYLGHLFTYHW